MTHGEPLSMLTCILLVVASMTIAHCAGDFGLSCDEKCSGRCGIVHGCICSECADGEYCEGGYCQDCETVCGAESCGAIGGCDCEVCEAPLVCQSERCVTCEEACQERECGTISGCNCGTCLDQFVCQSSTGQCLCDASCSFPDGKKYECGSNGCGKECATCESGLCEDHLCICQPMCSETVGGLPPECGPDGCGGTCGNCAADQWCLEYQCVTSCTGENVVFSPFATRVHELTMGAGGLPGEALDVDLNPLTCAPEDTCEEGRDNGMKEFLDHLSQFVDLNAEIALLLEEELVVLIELVEPVANGNPFAMRIYHGQKVYDEQGCHHQSQKCDYDVSLDSLSPDTCEPLTSFDNATVTGERLRAGGPGYSASLLFHSVAGMWVEATIHNVALEADLVLEQGDVALLNGLIGGAIQKEALMQGVLHTMEEDLEIGTFVLTSTDMANLLNDTLVPDLDLDSDGEKESVSFGLKFQSLPAQIVGVTEDSDWGIDL